jgi:2-hydroxychromene-2-carboxylate isomerase
MREAWFVHQQKRRDASNEGVPSSKLDEMGLKNYTWEEWQRYYRKMHGLPEDGIKRIPFEGKKKERQIDWNTRYALSEEEMAKYGIKMSKDGPVMIPLDKAMEASSALLQGAKTIHSIRDGLEVMKDGLKTETANLKKRREEGPPVAVVNQEEGGGAEQTTPTVPAPTPDQGS